MPGAYNQAALEETFARIGRRLEAIEAHLAVLSQQAGVPYSPPTAALPPDVAELVRAGKQLEAIKRYRELTGASFDDARAAVALA